MHRCDWVRNLDTDWCALGNTDRWQWDAHTRVLSGTAYRGHTVRRYTRASGELHAGTSRCETSRCWAGIKLVGLLLNSNSHYFPIYNQLGSNNTGTAKALKSSSWTFHGNTTTIYCFPAARKLPKFFHVENFLFELLFRLGHVSWHSLIPQMVHQDLTDFLTDWGDSGDA